MASTLFSVVLRGASACLVAGPLAAQFDPAVVLREGGALIPTPAGATDIFGRDIALDGDLAIVGAPQYDGANINSGAAYIYERVATGWVLRKQLLGTSQKANRLFGTSVDLDGEWAIVGSPRDTWAGDWSGAVHIFQRVGNNWVEDVRLTAFDGESFHGFGSHVGIDGDTAVVFATGDDDLVDSSGAFYVYGRNGAGSWIFQQKVKAALPTGQEGFGTAFDFEGDRVAISAPYHGDLGAEWGAVHVFDRVGGVWSETQKVVGSTAFPGRFLGAELDLSGDRIVASESAVEPGQTEPAVSLFEFDGTTWLEVERLRPEVTSIESSYGSKVAIDGDTIAVRDALWWDGSTSRTGAVVCFQKSGPVWRQRGVLIPSGAQQGATIGDEIAVDSHRVMTSNVVTSAPGSAWVFFVPQPPETYCVAKPHTGGCTPRVSWRGFPSATASNEFTITALDVLNQKPGILFYGFGSNNLPFRGGTLCVATPTKRTPPASSAGNVGPPDCSGGFANDFLAQIQAGVDPALGQGAEVYAQYWYRDPADAFGTGLTDAVSFTVGP